jgi:hypothetical protein
MMVDNPIDEVPTDRPIPPPPWDQWTQPDSRQPGYIQPTPDSPQYLEDYDIEHFLQQLVFGVTGMPTNMVRPRWQELPPKSPERNIDWCAIGIVEQNPDANAAFIHHSYSPENQLGYSEMQRHEEIEILASFYGPHCRGFAHLLRDGLSVAQNREAMMLNGMGFVASGKVRQAPELVNMAWRRRYDFDFVIRHVAIRYYPVRNLLTAHGTIHKDNGSIENWATQPYPEPRSSQLELPLGGKHG